MSEQPADALPDKIKTMRFVVAERNPSLQKNVVSYLKQAGAERIDAVKDGSEAWALWTEKRQVDMFVCAANLPELGGLELVAKLRADKEARTQPGFLLISADKSESAQSEAKAKGADGFLGKPFSQDQFIPKLVEVMGARQASDSVKPRGFSLEDELMLGRLPVELIFDRYTTEVECEELSEVKCVIRVHNNYGLGTQLNMRFSRIGGGEGEYFKPLKGIVMKTERIPREIGVFLLHVQFNGPVKEAHGVPELIRLLPAPANSD